MPDSYNETGHYLATKDTVWSKIKENRLVMACIIFLCLLSLLAIFAYVVIPDASVNANRQIARIALSSPGTSQDFLLKKKNFDVPPTSFFSSMIRGRRDRFDYIPYTHISFDESQITTSLQGAEQYHDPFDIIYNINNNTDENKLGRKAIITKIKNSHLISKYYLMGTDKYGRDVWSRLILGLRASLLVGFLAVVVSLFIGITIGSLGGYYGGWIDKVTMLIINTSWSIPTLLMAFAIIIALGKGFLVIILAVGLTMWVDVARIVRGQVMQTKNELYVKAAGVLGFRDYRTITRHILPNITGPILVMAAANFATAILVEAGLSFLGVGIQPPTPSLGNMLQESYAYATGGFVYLALFPILMIMTLVLSFNLLGTGLRDVMDIKSMPK